MNRIASPLDGIAHVRHGFFTREGGAGTGAYESLNCAWGTVEMDPAVEENRARVAAELGVGAESLLSLYQIHSPAVVHVTGGWHRQGAEADAMVCTRPGLALGILTADCMPVLFAARGKEIIGAAHAGWKGALTGVLENTVRAMEGLGAARDDITAVIGPCIGPRSYEVSMGFDEPFIAQAAENSRFFTPGREGHLMFDLPGYAAHRLSLCGVGSVHDVKQDTLSREDKFFSYRRATLRGEPSYGRLISAIALAG